MRDKFRKYLSREIAIEYKACLYFACILAFYFVYLLYKDVYEASIPVMFEMILTAYAAGYLQVCLLHNFDESEQLGMREFSGIFFCTVFYAAVSYLLKWYERSLPVTVLFFGYIFVCYLCVYLCNRIKRKIDTEKLNRMLQDYQRGETHGKAGN